MGRWGVVATFFLEMIYNLTNPSAAAVRCKSEHHHHHNHNHQQQAFSFLLLHDTKWRCIDTVDMIIRYLAHRIDPSAYLLRHSELMSTCDCNQ